MNVNRRKFIFTGMAGLAGSAGCYSPRESQPTTSSPGGPQSRAERNLVLHFSGLYGFVFNGSPMALDVLLIDTDQTSLKGHPHFARLRTDRANIHSGNSTKETGEQKISFKEILPFWDLKRHRVTIESAGALPPLSKISNRRRDLQSKKPGEDPEVQADTFWLPSMDRIVGAGKGRINPACLSPDPTSAKIASRLHFTGGVASARFQAPFQDVVWQIARPGESAPIEQAFGELRFSIPLSSDAVTFNLEPFGGGPTKRVMFQAKSTGDTILEILNEPEPRNCKDNSEVRELKHFQTFYELLAPPNQSTAGPFPICPDATCRVSCAPAESRTVYCPGTEYGP
jgi:hypothetical protein